VKPIALRSITATVLVSLAACYGACAGASAQSLGTAGKACSEIAIGSTSNAVAACAQGYRDAGATLAKSCAFGVGLVEGVEDERDCKFGFIVAGGVKASEPSSNTKAESECAPLTEGATDGAPAACEQGYEDALAGEEEDASCDHLEAGAITAVEYVASCEDGWAVAKGEAPPTIQEVGLTSA
jgi:hypothetical protein